MLRVRELGLMPQRLCVQVFRLKIFQQRGWLVAGLYAPVGPVGSAAMSFHDSSKASRRSGSNMVA